MRSTMGFRAKRELLAQVAPRYHQASEREKTIILNELVATTGYARKYAIRLLSQPSSLATKEIRRPRKRRYGKEVQAALAVAWNAANGICAKRLVPFLPELVPSLEEHGHLSLSEEVRSQLLAISPATADRILAQFRSEDRRGRATTKAGPLLKHQSLPPRRRGYRYAPLPIGVIRSLDSSRWTRWPTVAPVRKTPSCGALC